jgi:hypothetical protein
MCVLVQIGRIVLLTHIYDMLYIYKMIRNWLVQDFCSFQSVFLDRLNKSVSKFVGFCSLPLQVWEASEYFLISSRLSFLPITFGIQD